MRFWWFAALLALGLSSTAQAEDDWFYTLRPGDTLWQICQGFAQQPQACWRQLAEHNELFDPHRIQPGDTLRLPVSWLKEKPVPARLDAVTGQVTLYPAAGGASRLVSSGDTVDFGDAIETGAAGSARVTFADQSQAEIKPGSLVVVTRYRRFLDQQGESTELRLERGTLRNKVTPRPNQEPTFKVYTPGAVAAVRGTEYYVSVDTTETTRNEVVDGLVDVSASGSKEAVNQGYATLARLDEPPIKPVPMLPAPMVTLTLAPQRASAQWPEQAGADSYWVEWYRQPEGVLVGQASLQSGAWQQDLPKGDYRLLVRAVDPNGLKGHEAWQDFTVTRQSRWELWTFLGTTAVLLAL